MTWGKAVFRLSFRGPTQEVSSDMKFKDMLGAMQTQVGCCRAWMQHRQRLCRHTCCKFSGVSRAGPGRKTERSGQDVLIDKASNVIWS